jgi:hypothetical protein
MLGRSLILVTQGKRPLKAEEIRRGGPSILLNYEEIRRGDRSMMRRLGE